MIKKIGTSVFLFLATIGLSFAEEHSGGGHELSQIVGKVINSTILWGSLAYLLYKPIASFFRKKAESEKETFFNSKNERESSENRLKEVTLRVENLEKELKAIRERFKKEAEKDKEIIEKKIEEDVAKIQKFTNLEIERIYNEALKELKLFALNISLKDAEEKIRKRIDKGTQQVLIKRFLNEIERVN